MQGAIIRRPAALEAIETALAENPVCALLGPRQCGKTTLAQQVAAKRYGVEFKCSDAPVMTKSLHIALTDLKLERAWIVYPSNEEYPVHEKVRVCPLAAALKEVASRE
ncbi:MAG TPA: AAA family ATPase [Candidatus Paceibacterota bacterium]|nr:AAA family ATPase [Verrucomicrobiota bacterium]HRZ44293.1 AAA family ATPase [Candidatus Paceibacterota bacterium]HRZ92387.1 AAA family ATPase [Candidatus Paceibacterota bacterium]